MTDLSQVRKEIDGIDNELRKLLRKRAKRTQEIKQIKLADKIPTLDEEREGKILAKCKTEFEKKVYEKILEESRKLQG